MQLKYRIYTQDYQHTLAFLLFINHQMEQQSPNQDIRGQLSAQGTDQPKEDQTQFQARRQLLQQITTLSASNKKLEHRIAFFQPFKQRVLKYPSIPKINQLFQDYQCRKVAFKICYIGLTYNGLVVQADTTNTIEAYLLDVLYSLSLIPQKSPGPSFSRAGRTDKGVSAMGNVIALDLRTSIKKGQNTTNNMNYTQMINNLLPEDIRVLGFQEVSPNFNARHMCTQRAYKYFFAKGNLDLNLMQQAIQMFLGTHNFANFCKIDIENTLNYQRTITQASIHQATNNQVFNPLDQRTRIYYFYFKANSFLWHQIRYMVSMLFLVGEGQQKPTIVRDLLDLTKFPRKPNYPPASENSLILENCEYEQLEFKPDTEAIRQFYNTFHEMVSRKSLEKTLMINCMEMAQNEVVFGGSMTHEQFTKGAIQASRRGVNVRKKALGVHKSSIRGVEEVIEGLAGKKLAMYNKRVEKQNEYEAREKQKKKQRQQRQQGEQRQQQF